MPSGHALPLYALASWLLTELLGALMLRSWIVGGGARAARQRPARPDAMSLPVLAGHAGLNLAGLVCWICFVLSGVAALAWLALVFMAPAIGLGISTVTIWTPYPGGRDTGGSAEPGPAGSGPAGSGAAESGSAERGSAEPGPAESRPARGPARPGVMPEDELRRRLSDDELAAQLVDELLSRNFGQPTVRPVNWSLRPLIPLGHGVLAIVTFLLAVLAAVSRV